jgi:site-specific DNA recombinase
MTTTPSSASPHRAAIYCRVSSPGQEQDGTSLDTQETACRQYAAAQGYLVDEAYVYAEVYSGIELWQRPKLALLRDVSRRREVDVVIAYAIDRLSRDPVHLGVLLSEAEHAGVAIQFVSEPLDDSPEGQLIRFIRGYAAKVEHAKFVERSQRGKRARVERGRPLHGPRPLYGYRWVDPEYDEHGRPRKGTLKVRLLPDPLTAPIVQRIYREALAGSSVRAIARALTTDGIPTPTGRGPCWTGEVIADILHHPTYCGQPVAYRTRKAGRSERTVLRPDGEQVTLPPEVAPALVFVADWRAVQALLTRRQAQAPRRNRHPETHLLRGGYARCAYCGGTMHARIHHGGRQPVYNCAGNRYAIRRCEGAPTIDAAFLDGKAWERVEALVTRPGTIARELARMRATDPTEADLQAVDRQLAEVSRRQGNIARLAATLDDDDAAAPLQTELVALGARRRQLEQEREGILSRRAGWEAAQGRLAELEAWCEAVAAKLGTLTYAQRRLALEALGVEARVWRADVHPRYQITASIPLPPIASETSSG